MKTVVIGHNSPDIDSIASAIMESRRLNLKKQNAQAFIAGGELVKGTEEIMKYCKFALPNKWHKSYASSPTILVDYNDLDNGVKGLKNIIRVIDHHTKTEWVNGFENKQIVKLGATATLITERFLKEYEMSEKEAKLLLFAIVADTQNFSSEKTTVKDIEMAKKLEQIANLKIKKVAKLINKWSTFRFFKLKVSDYVKEDIKRSIIKGKMVASAVVVTNNYKPFLKNHKLIQKQLVNMIKAEVQLLSIQDLKHKKTVIIHNDVAKLANPYVKNKILGRRQIKILISRNI